MKKPGVSLLIFTCLFGFAIPNPKINYFNKEDYCTSPKLEDFIAEGLTRLKNNIVEPVPERDVEFILYTRKNPKKGQKLHTGNINSIKNSNFDPSKPLRILFHGFQHNLGDCVLVVLRNAYLRKGNFNVIVVDWSKIGTNFIYKRVLTYLKSVADVVNKFTRFLNVNFHVSFNNMYLIGHSLGAHLAGTIGRRLQYGKYNTIFGLEPAGPGFDTVKNSDVLRRGDAKYVETIHTDMSKFGYRGQIGDASIYPEFGFHQKKCTIQEVLKNPTCDHNAAFYYFAESLNSPKCYLLKRCYSFKQIKNHQCECYPGLRQDCRPGYFQLGGEPSQYKAGVFYLDVPNQCSK